MWQKLRISFDRSFTKSVWKQAAWFALFFFIFLVVFSLIGMFPALREVEDDSSNTFERIFYLLSTKQNYNSLIKGSSLLRWGYYTFVMILGSIVFGGMVSIISNMLNRHVSSYLDGTVTYKLKNHVVIVGYDKILPGLVSKILQHKGYDDSQVVVLCDQLSQAVRKSLCSVLDINQEKRCFVYYGKQDSKEDLRRLNLSSARRVFIKGNDKDVNHDSINVKTMQLMVDIIKEERAYAEQTDSGSSPATSHRIPFTVDFNDTATYSVFQVTDLSSDWRAHVSLTPYNFQEDWARRVFVEKRCYRNGGEWVKYPALDGEGITKDSDKHVRLVIIGMSQTGVTMGVQAAHLLHFPNALGHPENYSQITFVDPNIKHQMKRFQHRFKHLFETEEASFLDLSQQAKTETSPPTMFTGNDAHLLDVAFEFVNGQPESDEFSKLVSSWAADEKEILRIIVAMDDNKRNMSIGLYLPDIIYDKHVPVIIQQETSGYLLQLLHKSDNGKFSNLFPFATKEPTYDISEGSLVLAKSLNYLYWNVNPDEDKWNVEQMMQWGDDKMMEAWGEAEAIWQELSIANQWSNIYCAYNIFVKLRSLGINHLSECRLLTGEEVEMLAKVEHNRWTTEKLLLGFRKPTPGEQQAIQEDDDRTMTDRGPTRRDVFKKLKKKYIHADICHYDHLYEKEKDYDKVIVAHIPWLVKMYKSIIQNAPDEF